MEQLAASDGRHLRPADIEAMLHEGVPLARGWGLQVVEAVPGAAVLRLPPREDFLRPGGQVCGALMMGIADLAMWAALLRLSGGREGGFTTSLTMNFVHPPGSGALLAEAGFRKTDGLIMFGEVAIRAEDSNRQVAHAVASWARVPRGMGRRAAPAAPDWTDRMLAARSVWD
ncbi:PaaI family thioesterase [Falsiroseomonas sp. HW251]|uniref:PaaI family thioesterase n=1 Tax=Falsiroseomonas sp. HW251 TaxID=3390998 RepID=UPI003D31F941